MFETSSELASVCHVLYQVRFIDIPLHRVANNKVEDKHVDQLNKKVRTFDISPYSHR